MNKEQLSYFFKLYFLSDFEKTIELYNVTILNSHYMYSLSLSLQKLYIY